jgi:multidrug resistance protein
MANAKPLEQPAAGGRRTGAPFLVLFLTVFFDLLGFGIVIPFLPMYAARLGLGAAGIGLLLSVYSLMQLIFAPILGRLSDHFGRRPIIMIGLIGSSFGYLIYGFADSFFWLFASRALHGACAATVSTAQAYVADTTTEDKRARGMGMIGAAFGLGFVLGPAIGGLLGRSSLRTPVFFAAALTFANFIFAAYALPESHHLDNRPRLRWVRVMVPLLILPRQLTRHHLARLFTIAFLGTFAMSAFETTFALMAPRMYGYGAASIGGLFAFAGLIQAIAQGYLIGKLVGRIGETALIRAGMTAFAIGMTPMASLTSQAMLFVLLALLSFGYGLATPSVASLISKHTHSHLQGEVLGVNQSVLSLARICGPIAAGSIYQMLGPPTVYVAGGLVAILAAVLTRGTEAGA